MTTSDILTFLLVSITAVYAFLTYLILRANHKSVDTMRIQIEASLRPYISIKVFAPPESISFYLQITNTGKTTAENLRLKIDRDFYLLGKDVNIADLNAFKNTIKSFAPGMEILFFLATSPMLFNENSDEKKTPRTFAISASYEYGNGARQVEEKTTIDFNPFLETTVTPADPVVIQLKSVSDRLKEVKEEIKKIGQYRGS